MKKIMTRLLSLVLLGAFIPSFVLATEWDLEKGSITVNAVPGTEQTVTQGNGTPTEDTNPVITSSEKTSNTVTITAAENATAKVTLNNVNVDVRNKGEAAITTEGKGDVTIELDGTNTVKSGSGCAGLEKSNGGTLTITDKDNNGSLTATGGSMGAGIGGSNGDDGKGITISGGTVIATGGSCGAGIGGGSSGAGSTITIENGTVNAKGGMDGAGIGGGVMGNGTGITISGGNVEATGGPRGAGIGGGLRGNGSSITIKDGTVTAEGGNAGAGIGGGAVGGDGTDITVSGGEVIAKGGDSGAGIGGGVEGAGTDITVSNDAQVKVQGGEKFNDYCGTGAGIGDGGKHGQGGTELDQDPSKLNEGTIQYYAPGADMQTGAPTETLYNPNGNHTWDGGTVTTPATCTTPGVKTYTCQTHSAHTKTQEIPALGHQFETYVYNNDATTKADGTETAHCTHPGCTVTDTRTAKGTKLEATTQQDTNKSNEQTPDKETQQSPYWVTGPEGQSLTYQAQQKDGVLTVTVQADTASLHGTTESLRQLEAQGITEIRFVTNGAQSGFALSDLLASGTGSVTLTHAGDQVTFTLESKDISGILK